MWETCVSRTEAIASDELFLNEEITIETHVRNIFGNLSLAHNARFLHAFE
jgi:hypothetical protein